jgi:hypothetical protein
VKSVLVITVLLRSFKRAAKKAKNTQRNPTVDSAVTDMIEVQREIKSLVEGSKPDWEEIGKIAAGQPEVWDPDAEERQRIEEVVKVILLEQGDWGLNESQTMDVYEMIETVPNFSVMLLQFPDLAKRKLYV